MPAEGVALKPKSHILSFEEIVRLSSLFARNGVTKIRLTGGEPLIRKEIEQLSARLSALDGINSLAITTNGLLLSRKLEALKRAGVTGFNISLDTLKADRFLEITRRPGLEKVLRAIADASLAGYNPVKINCVVINGFNDDELADFVEMTREQSVDVRFIEYMPFDGNTWNNDKFMSYNDMTTIIRARFPSFKRLSEHPSETSKSWRVPGFKGLVGFISSMSEHFCAGCNRIRITADGNLKVCLFGAEEISLRDMMRSGFSDDELLREIREALSQKKASHAGMEEIAKSENRPMILIGG